MSSPTITAGYTYVNGELVTVAKANLAQTGLKPQVQTDKILGRTTAATGDWEEITFTDFAQSLADDTDATTARATLGVSDLTASIATDKLIGRTTAGTGAPEAVTCTDFAQSVLAAADAAAVRTLLSVETPARCTSALNVTDDTLTDVAGMSVTLTTGSTYTVEVIISYAAGASNTPTFRLTGTATGSAVNGTYSLSQSSVGSGGDTSTSLPVDVSAVPNVSGIEGLLFIALTIVCDGTGTLKLQLKGEDGSSDVTVRLGSYMKVFKY